jgi:hypothetical protein
MSRSGALSQIETLITDTVITPAFAAVVRGEPVIAPHALPMAAFYLLRQEVLTPLNSLIDESTASTFAVKTFHPSALDQNLASDIVGSVWDCVAALRTSLLADSTLDGNASLIELNSTDVSTVEFSGSWFVQSETQLVIWLLSDTTVSS